MYVCDRLVLPSLTREEIDQLGRGEASLDAFTRDYVRKRMTYRFVELGDGATARIVEAQVRAGALGSKPLLNPAN